MEQDPLTLLPEQDEKKSFFPWAALALPLVSVFCCSLTFLPAIFSDDGLLFYWRDFVRIGIAEIVFCFGGLASLAAIVLGGMALVQGQKSRAASIAGIVLGILVGISACLVAPFFFLLMISSA